MKTIEDLRADLQAATPEVRAIAKMIADGLMTIIVTEKGNEALTWTPDGERWYAEIVALAEAQAAQAQAVPEVDESAAAAFDLRIRADAPDDLLTDSMRHRRDHHDGGACTCAPEFIGTTPSPEGEYR